MSVLRLKAGAPYGNRTRVSALRGRRPRPLDEGSDRCDGFEGPVQVAAHSHGTFKSTSRTETNLASVLQFRTLHHHAPPLLAKFGIGHWFRNSRDGAAAQAGFDLRHGRTCSGHPRLCIEALKTWMPAR